MLTRHTLSLAEANLITADSLDDAAAKAVEAARGAGAAA